MELFKLLGKIGVDNQEAIDGMNEASDKAEETSGKFGEVLSNIGSAATKMASVVAVGITAVATGLASLTKDAVSNYADYEQVLGGAELLFGEAYDYIAQKAQNAYATVQMSQTDYLTQVNGFAVGLRTALDGDEMAAAELADRILVAEADIVAATGNSQEAISNAFNGIMKSNFTMLDSLQLGITPTKEGFQELIDSVNAWNAENGRMAEYTIDNLADCQSALVDYVEMQGLAGYASNEASETISGSISMLKAAWQNFITGMADENQDSSVLIDNLMTSFEAVETNLIPRIQTALPRIISGISSLAQILATNIPSIIESLLPTLISGAVSLIQQFVQFLPTIISILSQESGAIISGIMTIFDAIGNEFPNILNQLTTSVIPQVLQMFLQIFSQIIANLPSLFQNLIRGIENLLPQLISGISFLISSVASMLPELLQILIQELPNLLIMLTNSILENFPIILEALISLFLAIVSELPNLIQMICDLLPTLVGMVVTALLQNLPTIIMGIIQIVWGIVQALPQIIISLIQYVPSICRSILDAFRNQFPEAFAWLEETWDKITTFVGNLFDSIVRIVKGAFDLITLPFRFIWENCKDKVFEVWNSIVNFLTPIFDGIKNTVSSVFGNVKDAISNAFNTAKTAVSTAINSIETTISSVFNSVKNTVTTIWNNIKDAITTPIETAKNTISNIVNTIMGIFGGMNISFPSIKLPHFSVSPSGWEIGDLLQGIIPSLSISWYAKGGILDGATPFGQMGNNLLIGGEAGKEAVIPLEKDTRGIELIASKLSENIPMNYNNDVIQEKMNAIIALLEKLLGMKITLDSGVLIGELAPAMDLALGTIADSKGRGDRSTWV